MSIPPNDLNSTPKTFSNLDWTALTITAIPTALSAYAFHAATKAETTPSMLFHTTIGLLSAKYALGFGMAWKKNKVDTPKAEFISQGIHAADNLGRDILDGTYSIFSSLYNKKDPSKNQKFANAVREVINQKDSSSPST